MGYMSGLRCLECGKDVPVKPFQYTCAACGGYLDVEYDYEQMGRDLTPGMFESRTGPILRQWLEFMPIDRPELIERVTLGEQPTPMFRARSTPPGGEAWLKNDAQLPTCSLKDRSIPLTVLKALELGREAVGIVSSGNAAASLAACAARAGLKAVVFLGSGPSSSKLYKSMVHRPVAVEIQADYSQADALFQQARDEFGFFDRDGLVNPYRIEGKKSFAYEMARDLGWRAPSTVLMPTAYGNGMVAAWKGFKELYRLGFIDSLPRMVAVQPAEVAPIARAFARGLDHVEPVNGGHTIAQAVSVADPALGGQRTLSVAPGVPRRSDCCERGRDPRRAADSCPERGSCHRARRRAGIHGCAQADPRGKSPGRRDRRRVPHRPRAERSRRRKREPPHAVPRAGEL